MSDHFDWRERLTAAVAEAQRKREARKRVRADLAKRRAYGLAQRHAAKLERKE